MPRFPRHVHITPITTTKADIARHETRWDLTSLPIMTVIEAKAEDRNERGSSALSNDRVQRISAIMEHLGLTNLLISNDLSQPKYVIDLVIAVLSLNRLVG